MQYSLQSAVAAWFMDLLPISPSCYSAQSLPYIHLYVDSSHLCHTLSNMA